MSQMVLADFSIPADNILDVFAIDPSSSSGLLLFGNGDGTFQPPVSIALGNGPTALFTVDTDGDGAVDLLLASLHDDHAVEFFNNSGGGNITPAGITITVPNSSPVDFALLPGPAPTTPYVALANDTSPQLRIWSTATSTESDIVVGTNAARAIVSSADFNGDTVPDLAVLSDDSKVYVLLANGTGTGTFGDPVGYTSHNTASMIVADVNGDGLPDVVTSGANGVSVLLGNSDGTFQAEAQYDSSLTGGDGHAHVVAANLAGHTANLAGHTVVDLVHTVDGTPGKLSVLINNGDGTFPTTGISASTTDTPTAVAAGLLNNDAYQDLVVVNRGSNGSTSSALTQVLSLQGEQGLTGACQAGVCTDLCTVPAAPTCTAPSVCIPTTGHCSP
jgi:hypothetical protein